jgi:photosynthetic reaction center cytochrome c subunit
MRKSNRSYVAAIFLAAAALTIAVVAAATAHGQAPAAQSQSPAAAAPKLAKEAFKNIQILEDVPADQIIPSMQFIAASLGVECEHCHVQGAFDKDDKEAKQTARKMMQMMFAINKDNFHGKKVVTCFSCHRGSTDPVGIPIIAETEAPPEPPKPEVAANSLPSADDLIAKYVQALGGKDAIEKISSRVITGKMTTMGHSFPIDIYAKAPDKRISIAHMDAGDIITASNGQTGWLGNPGRPARAMSAAESQGARFDADLHFATDLKQIFTGFTVHPPEKIGEHDAWLVFGVRENAPPVRLYFDKESGLLVRMVRYTDTALGLNPVQIDFADYRDAGGTKVPYRWTLARPSGRFTIQADKMQENIPVDDAKFAMPPPPPPTEKKP